MECSDTDIRRASEIVMRITLHTTAHVKDIDRSATAIGRRLEVDILSDEERIEFEERVKSILSPANQYPRIRERVAA